MGFVEDEPASPEESPDDTGRFSEQADNNPWAGHYRKGNDHWAEYCNYRPVVIGNDCTIGPNCCIMPNTSIGSRVNLDPFTVIGDAIIMDDTAIGSHSRIVETVIGERCTLADHTSISTATGLMDIEGCTIRSEFGAILGDNMTNGPFTVYKKCVVGNNVTIEGQNSISSRNIPDGSMVI